MSSWRDSRAHKQQQTSAETRGNHMKTQRVPNPRARHTGETVKYTNIQRKHTSGVDEGQAVRREVRELLTTAVIRCADGCVALRVSGVWAKNGCVCVRPSRIEECVARSTPVRLYRIEERCVSKKQFGVAVVRKK